MIQMYMPYKYILQKDVPERMSESNFGLKYLRNDIYNIYLIKEWNHMVNRWAFGTAEYPCNGYLT